MSSLTRYGSYRLNRKSPSIWAIFYLVYAERCSDCKPLRTCRHLHEGRLDTVILQEQGNTDDGPKMTSFCGHSVHIFRFKGLYTVFITSSVQFQARVVYLHPFLSLSERKIVSAIFLGCSCYPRRDISQFVFISSFSLPRPASPQLSNARSVLPLLYHCLQVPRNDHCLLKQLNCTVFTALLT
jgi:hypothetical protein